MLIATAAHWVSGPEFLFLPTDNLDCNRCDINEHEFNLMEFGTILILSIVLVK